MSDNGYFIPHLLLSDIGYRYRIKPDCRKEILMINRLSPQKKAAGFAILAAALYAVNSPVSKLLLNHVPAALLAGFLYLGAGIGMFFVGKIQNAANIGHGELPLTKKDLPFTVGMVVLDIAAPICLMAGLANTTAANASLLNNFEIVATSVIALLLFGEAIRPRLWCAIACVTAASAMLSFEDINSLSFSFGSLLVLLAAAFWGLENNCTRMLSTKNPLQIVTVKGIFSGLGSLACGIVIGERYFQPIYILLAMLLGFVAYGLSIFFYIYAQRTLGAAKTSAYYAVAPFIGAALSFLIFHEMPSGIFLAALLLMLLGTYLA